jgi:hypothetical protein
MGMRSSFDWEEIEVKDWKGLEEFIKIYVKYYGKDWEVHNTEGKVISNIISEMIVKGEEGCERQFSFESWDNIKLISYYYDNQIIFFEGISPFIEGEVHWRFETDEESCSVEFRDGVCFIEFGTMNYQTKLAKSQIKERDKIPEEIKNHIAVNELTEKKIRIETQ